MQAKRVIGAVLAVLLLTGLFAGCSGGETSSAGEPDTGQASGNSEVTEEEPYEINYLYYVSAEHANQEAVSEAVNELAMEELNMKVNLIPMTMGTYNSQIALLLAGNEPLDIFPTTSTNFATYIEAGNIVNLADHLDVMQEAVDIIGEEDVNACYIGDFLVGMPQMRERTSPAGLIVRKDIFEELGYSVEDFQITTEDYSSFDQITQLFADVKAAYPNMIAFDGTTIMATYTDNYVDNLGNMFGVLENYGQTTEITNRFESEQYRAFCEIAREWFTKGYSSADIAVNEDSGETKMKAGNSFSFICGVKPNTAIEKYAQTGYEVEVIELGNQRMRNTYSVSSGPIAIASASEDPEKAAIFMNWTYTSGEFNDLINWGVEGQDWIETEDGLAAYPEGVDAGNVGYHNDFGWAYPNQFAGHAWDGNPADIWEQYETYNTSTPPSMAFGFSFDSTAVTDEIAQLTTVYDRYAKDIGFGVVEIEPALEEFNDALYAAGLQTVMDEKQRQLDEWLANQS